MDLNSRFNTPQKATIVTRAIGSFHFDCVKVEEHLSNLSIPNNPIEAGENIANHVVLEPKQIKIIGVMVGYEPQHTSIASSEPENSQAKRYPFPMRLQAVTQQSEQLVNRQFLTASPLEEPSKRATAPFLPESSIVKNDHSSTLYRIGRAYDDLLKLQKNGETIEVQTGIKLYQNMLIESISLSQEREMDAEFTLSLREVFIVKATTSTSLNLSSIMHRMGITQPTVKSFIKYLGSTRKELSK